MSAPKVSLDVPPTLKVSPPSWGAEMHGHSTRPRGGGGEALCPRPRCFDGGGCISQCASARADSDGSGSVFAPPPARVQRLRGFLAAHPFDTNVFGMTRFPDANAGTEDPVGRAGPSSRGVQGAWPAVPPDIRSRDHGRFVVKRDAEGRLHRKTSDGLRGHDL